MLSQFSIGFASAAVLVCVWVGTLLRREPRTEKMRFSKWTLTAALAVSAVQTAAAWLAQADVAVLPVWSADVSLAIACAVSPAPALAGFECVLGGARDSRFRAVRSRWIAAAPLALCVLTCSGLFVWMFTGGNSAAPLASVASGFVLLYACSGALLLFPKLSGARSARERWGSALWASCTAAGCVACFAGAGLASLALGEACGAIFLNLFLSSPSDSAVPGTRLYSRKAFLETVRDCYEQNRTFTCTAVVLPQLALLEQSCPPEQARALLCELSAYLSRAARRSPVYRFAPSVFVVVDRGSERRERMMAEMETRFERPWGASGRMNLHFVKLYAPDDCADAACLIHALTELSARASRTGSPMLLSCDEEIQMVAARRKAVAAALNAALDAGTLEVVFQPIYTPRVHRVTAAKVCARLTGDAVGEIPDAELRACAREVCAELRFGAFLFERMCAQVGEAGLIQAGVETLYFELSALEWRRRGFADELAEMAHKNGMDLHRLVFELPEECLCGEADECLANADRLSAFGAQIALSRFGAGECNLSRVLSLDAKLIKLDSTLVWAYCRGETPVPDYLAPMFTAKGKRLVAEGIEIKRHADAMTRLGCVGLQGDYYARPMEAAALVAFVTSATSAWEQFVREHAAPEPRTQQEEAEA